MKEYMYHIGFFLVLCSLALLEFFVAPPYLYEGDKKLYEAGDVDISQDIKRNTLPNRDFLYEDLKKNLKNISVSVPEEVDHLFYFASFTPEKDNVRISKKEYFQKNEIGDYKKVIVVYEIFSTKPRTIISAYEDVKNRIKLGFLNSLESFVIEDNQYGNKSFSIRLEEGQKTVYIVAAHRDRLLGFEYPLDTLGSRHEEIEKILLQVFSN